MCAVIEGKRVDGLRFVLVCEDDAVAGEDLDNRSLVPEPVDKIGTTKDPDSSPEPVVLEPDEVGCIVHSCSPHPIVADAKCKMQNAKC